MPLILLAVAIRIPYLTSLPAWTDETGEALLGLTVARGQALPFTNMVTYIGPLWNYLLAAGFALAGPALFLPRLLVCAFGVLTVLAVLALGTALAGRVCGVVASSLMATSAIGVIIGSHVAWSASTTPFFFAASLACLVRARSVASGRWLAAAGLLFGLAVHSHPVVGAAGPGLLAALLLDSNGRRLLRTPWSAAALTLILLPQLPVLVSQAANGALTLVLAEQRNVTFAPTANPADLAARFEALGGQLLRMVTSNVQEGADLFRLTARPQFDLFAAWLLLGCSFAWRRRAWLLLLPVASYALLWAPVNRSYGMMFEARFPAFLLPSLYATMALPAAALFARLNRRSARFGLMLALSVLVAWPLVNLAAFYRAELSAGRSNAFALDAVDTLQQADSAATLVALDCGLKKPGMGAGNSYFSQLGYMMAMQGRAFLPLDLNDRAALRSLSAAGPNRLLLVARPSTLDKLSTFFSLEPLKEERLSGEPLFTVYRASRPGQEAPKGARRELLPGCAATEDDTRLTLPRWAPRAVP